MQCPRDHVDLIVEHHKGIEVDRCPQCNGRWLDHGELDALEALTAPDPSHRRAMVEYGKRESELECPVCGRRMRAFNYRAYDLELDTCQEEHGFWLDAGEEGRVHDVMDERVRGLARASSAEDAWGRFLGTVGRKSFWDNIRGMLGGRRG